MADINLKDVTARTPPAAILSSGASSPSTAFAANPTINASVTALAYNLIVQVQGTALA